MTRPGRALVGGVRVAEFQDGHLLEQLADGSLTAAPPVPTAAGSAGVADVIAALTVDLGAAEQAARTPGFVFWRLLVSALDRYSPTGPLALPSVPALQATLSAALSAVWPPLDPAVVAVVKDLIVAIDRLLPDGPWAARVVLGDRPFVTAYGQLEPGGRQRGDHRAPRLGTGVPAPDARPRPDQGVHRRVQQPGRLDQQAPAAADRPHAEAGADRPGHHRPWWTAAERGPRRPDPRRAAGPTGPGRRIRRLRPVLAYPVFTEPMVEALRALDPDYILPNFGALPQDTLTLMAPNGRFIEALFAGLNTELARELLWREYPTDQRGSYFRVFWSHADAMSAQTVFDVEELHRWTPPLGTNATNAGTPIVLVMRSDLLRKFPRPLIYAQAAHRDANRIRHLDDSAAPILPAFQATIDPDVTMFGFNLLGDPFTNGDDEGYYFVIKERAGQLRFGLDEHAPAEGVGDWDDLSWEHLPGVADHLIVATTPTQVPPVKPGEPGEPVWAGSAADMASILIRSQVMYARHAVDMLPGDDS